METASKKLRSIIRKKTGSNQASGSVGPEPLGAAGPSNVMVDLGSSSGGVSPNSHVARRHPLLKSASVSSMFGSHHLPSPTSSGDTRLPPLRSPKDTSDSQQQQQQQQLHQHQYQQRFAFTSFADEVKQVMDSALALRGALHDCVSAAAAANGDLAAVVAREKLGQLLLTLRPLLDGYNVQHTEDILETTGSLMAEVKGLENNAQDRSLHLGNAQRALDMLVVRLSYSAMAFMYGDQRLPSGVEEDEYDQEAEEGGEGENDAGFIEEDAAISESYQTAARSSTDADSSTAAQLAELPPGMNSIADTDAGLLEVESAVDHALNRAKVWSQYAKSIIAYVDKRNTLEGDFSRNLQKLAQSLQPAILDSSFVPFQRAFTLAIAHDLDYCNMSASASTMIQVQKFVEPLVQCRTEHDRQRRSIKDMWLKSLKRENDAVVNMKKARALYEQRWHEYEKAKDTAAKGLAAAASSSASLAALPDVLSGGGASAASQRNAEKKKRLEEDAWHRTLEAEIGYKAYIAEANARHHELIKMKELVLQKVRDLLLSGDQALKAATTSYFQLRRDLAMIMPVQLQMLFDVCSSYPPGAQYEEFANDFLQRHGGEPRTPREPYAFEPYRPDSARGGMYRGMSGTGSALAVESRASLTVDEATSPRFGPRSPVSDDSDSDSSSESSPLTSPRLRQRSENTPTGEQARSKPVSGHLLRKLRRPSRCRLCDSYVYFGGEECEKCGLVCHRKCLRSSSSQCVAQSQQPPRRMTTFGVDVTEHVTAYNVEVPILISRCIHEIEKRGIQIKGIYRLSGVKSKVEKLCQSFENGRASEVDLSEHNPVVISNVLKLYLRQLPEPLLTNKFYPDFIGLAKEQLSGSLSEEQAAVKVLELLQRLPKANHATLRVIVCHLRRVSQLAAENQMNANNIGIVFGPTLMQSSTFDVDDVAPLSALMDASHQARVVELLIKHAPVIFDYEEDQLSLSSGVDLSRSSRDQYSLSSDGAESNLSFQESSIGNTLNLRLPEIDSSPGDEKDCNGSAFPRGTSSSDALSDVCTSADRLSMSDGEYCEIAEGAFVAEAPGGTAAGTALPLERPAVHLQSQQQLPKSNGVTAVGPHVSELAADAAAVVFSLADPVSRGGSIRAAAAQDISTEAAATDLRIDVTDADTAYTRSQDNDPELECPPIPPPRMRRSLVRKASYPDGGSPPSPKPPVAAERWLQRRSMDAGTVAALLYDSCPGSALTLHSSLHSSSRDSLGASTSALDVDAPLPSITRSKSMSRIVFYSDFDTAGPSASEAAGSSSPAEVAIAAAGHILRSKMQLVERSAAGVSQARPAQRARSMKRMSDTPHFV